MALIEYCLGELIGLTDERNTSGKYLLDSLKGISTEKTFIDTKANMDGVSIDSYKVVHPNEFAYVPDTSRRGDKIALAFNSTDESVLISSIYTTFKCVRDDLLIPEYLFMYFNRPEFDRYSRFNSWGSARETFSWDDFCDIRVILPDVSVQKKYVNTYLSLKNNLESYLGKINELKLACDSLIDAQKKTAPQVCLSELLMPVDIRNHELNVSEVMGININKSFFPTVADVDVNSTHNYKIVEPGQFAFSGMQTGRDMCIRIALNNESKPIIVSPAYTVLMANNNLALNHYILLWFSRSEIDRFGWFASDGSIRSNLDLERFFEMKIPLPSLSVQKSVASLFQCYLERQQIAGELRERLNNLCPILIKGSITN